MSAYIVPTAKEAIAVQLYHQGRTMAQIQTNTGLDREQILAAVDRDATERQRNPNTPPPPPERATTKPAARNTTQAPGKDEKIRALTALINGVRKHLAEYEAELAELLGIETPAPAVGPDLAESEEVRAWAIAEGWQVPDGTRLPGGIVAAYKTRKAAA